MRGMLTNAGNTEGEGAREWKTMLLTHFPCLIPGVRQRGEPITHHPFESAGGNGVDNGRAFLLAARACVCGSTVRRWAGTV